MGDVLLKTAWAYYLTIVVAMGVAALIRVLVLASVWFDRKKADAAAAAAPAGQEQEGVPEEDVAAISAALAATLGAHRIVHIGVPGRSRAWSAEGRALLHNHHSPHGPKR
jgi:hypothetical protein